MGVTVFTTGPGCFKCNLTKKHLTNQGVEFEEIRTDLDEAWAERLKALGYAEAPVVLVGEDDVWSGFSSDSLYEWFPKAG